MSDDRSPRMQLDDIADAEPRDGYALLLAIVALAVMGALIMSSHALAIRAHREGELRLLRAEALAAAEYGVERVAANAPTVVWRGWPPGARDSAGPWTAGRTTVRVMTTRLGDSLRPIVMIESHATAGTVPGRRASRSTSLTLAVNAPGFAPLASLTITGPVSVGAGATVEGADTPPAGWSCPVPGAALPGIATPDAASVSSSGCGAACIGGAPPIFQTPLAADSSTFLQYGELDWTQLTSVARAIPLTAAPVPAVVGGSCSTADSLNWGDPGRATPAGPCEGYVPILHAAGDLHMTGGVGQGVLLIDGNLTISGGARFVGVVIARGSVQGTGSGGRIDGAVLAHAGGGSMSSSLDSVSVFYSRCAIAAAESAAERGFPIRFRSWIDVYR